MIEKNEFDRQLEAEYKMLIDAWWDFDRRTLGIKGWVAAGSLVALIGIKPDASPAAVWSAIAVILIAWFTDAIWKSWQHAFGDRIEAIERYFRGEAHVDFLFQIMSDFSKVNGKKFSWCRAFSEMRQPYVFFPYLPLMVLFMLWEKDNIFRFFRSVSACVTQ